MRCVAPAQDSVSIYGQPWCAFFSFSLLRYLLLGFRFCSGLILGGVLLISASGQEAEKKTTYSPSQKSGLVLICGSIGLELESAGAEDGAGRVGGRLRFRAYRQKMAMRASVRQQHPGRT